MKDKRLLIIFLTVFIDLVGFGIIIPMIPYLAREFGANPFKAGLLMSIYSLMQFIFSPLWGQWSDRIGRRPVILISLFAASVAHLGFSLSTTLLGLFIARAVAGVCGGNISAAMAYMADITSEKERSKGMGLIGAAFGLGFILGPAIGGICAHVGHNLGDTAPFGESFPALIASVICFANFLFAWKALPESRKLEAPTAAPTEKKTGRWRRIFDALSTPTLNIVILLVFLNTFALAHIEVNLFTFVQEKFHWSLLDASFGFAYIGVIMVLTQGYFIRRFLPKYGERNLLTIGLILCAIGFALCATAGSIPALAFAVTAIGFGYGLANPSLSGSVSLLSGSEVQGKHLGVSQSLSSLARILGPATGGYLYAAVGPWSPFAFAALVAFAGWLIALAVRQRLPQGGKHAHG